MKGTDSSKFASPLWWTMSLRRCEALQRRRMIVSLVEPLHRGRSNKNQSRPLFRKKDSLGRDHYDVKANHKALVFIHWITAWKASSVSLSQILNVLSNFNVRFLLFSFASSESVATLHTKIRILWGTCALQLRFHRTSLPFVTSSEVPSKAWFFSDSNPTYKHSHCE